MPAGSRHAPRAYESRVLVALQEVEDALVSLAQEQTRREHLTAATDAAQQASDLSPQLYTAGLRDLRDVLDAQRSTARSHPSYRHEEVRRTQVTLSVKHG